MYTSRKRIKSCGRVMTSKEIQGEIENRETKSYKKSSHKSVYLPTCIVYT